jgi:hypothetical protein
LNQKRLVGTENPRVGKIMKNIIRLLCVTTSENPECYLYIPQPTKGIYVLNIIIQNIMEKRRSEGKGPQGNTQNLNAPNRGIET